MFKHNGTDLSAFSQENFDPKEWINNVFHSSEAQRDRNKYASSLAMKLQLAIQEVNSSLEETCHQVIVSLPRVMRDVESLSHEVSVLQKQMTSVRTDVERVEQSTAISMQTLVKLDELKSRLVSSSDALKEADNWTTLLSGIEEVVDSCDIDLIGKKLIALQSCLNILTHVPDYDERAACLESLKIRLEALASPYIVAAFTQHNLEESLRYASVLNSLGRSKQLESYYNKCEESQLLNAWKACIEGYQLSGPPLWLSSFYDKVMSVISNQLKWCKQVFSSSNPHLLLANLVTSTLVDLDPPLSQVLSSSIKQQWEPLAFLVLVKKYMDSFLADLGSCLDCAAEDEELFIVERKLVKSVYLPYNEQIMKYKEYEEALLLSHLVSAEIVQKQISESLRKFREYCKKILEEAEKASERCIQVSNAWAFPYLIRAFKSYISEISIKLHQLAEQIELYKSTVNDDWNLFSVCLVLIQAAGDLVIAVDKVEHLFASAVANMAAKIPWKASTSFDVSPLELLSNEAIKSLRKCTQIVEEDERLLESSLKTVQEECQFCVEISINTIKAPIFAQLSAVSTLSCWNDKKNAVHGLQLSATFSPQEYITQIGQYLMTLPQHLEPLLVNHCPSLNRALQDSNVTASPEKRIVSESEISAADFIINSIGQSTCKLYADAILKIQEISPAMITQLTTDIDYVCSILEDLGVATCDPLDKLNTLLKTPPSAYWSVAPGYPPRLIAAVRQIRNIPPQKE